MCLLSIPPDTTLQQMLLGHQCHFVSWSNITSAEDHDWAFLDEAIIHSNNILLHITISL